MRFYFLFCILILVACQREDSDLIEPIDVIEEETETFFDSHFIGKTIDVNGSAVENVQVSIADDLDYTTENGVFLFNNTKTNSTGALIKMSKDGYFDQYSFTPKATDQFSNLTVVLRKKSNHQDFNSTVPNEMTINQQIKLSIPAAAFSHTNGTPYQGQVRFYVDFAPVIGNIPIVDKNFKKGILINDTKMQFVFETMDGVPLEIAKPLLLIVNTNNVVVARLDIDKSKWVETLTKIENSQIIATIGQNIPYIVGQLSPVTKISTRIVNEVQTGVSFTKLFVKSDFQEGLIVQTDQDGNASFYVPSDVDHAMVISDICGNVITESTIKVGKDIQQQIPNIVLQSQDLLTVKSKIDACGLPLSDDDLVNVLLQTTGPNAVAYQSQNEQIFVFPRCMQIAKASYFRGKDRQFSVTFSGNANDQFLNINAMPLCIEKISGFFSVNDVPVLLDMSQYYIYRETVDMENVVISDLNGFLISIPNVIGKGLYKADAIIFNHPKISDCTLETCNNIKIYIDEISNPGEIVKIRVEGTMDGNTIKGEFVNLLKN